MEITLYGHGKRVVPCRAPNRSNVTTAEAGQISDDCVDRIGRMERDQSAIWAKFIFSLLDTSD
jgi:hypothetical protein